MNEIISIVSIARKHIPNHFDTFRTNPASFSVLLIFSSIILLISLSVNSSKLTLKICDNSTKI